MRRIIAPIAALLAIVLLAFTACKPAECTEHVDVDKNGRCDVCDVGIEPAECTEHADTDENGKCDVCGAEVKLPECTEHVDTDENGECDVCHKTVEDGGNVTPDGGSGSGGDFDLPIDPFV